MCRLKPEKLTIEYREGITMTEPMIPRRYTLTHSDSTGELFLTIAPEFAFDKVTAMRDEVLGEWLMEKETIEYSVYLHIDGQQGQKITDIRDYVFRRELPLALEAIRYGDREFFEAHPELKQSQIIVYFESTYPEYNKIESWGTFADYSFRNCEGLEVMDRNLINTDDFPYDIEIAAINLNIPWALDISRDGTLYITERTGSIWIMRDGRFLPEPLITFTYPFISQGEGGLLGIVLDPDFLTNRYIYVMHSYVDNGTIYNRVVRLTEQNDKVSNYDVIIDKIPGGRIHNGGRIKIGPDQKLYITTGDSGRSELAQDITSLAGKILRINLDGGIPEDNPFRNLPVYSYGHRNPQGLAWNSNNLLYASEHGQFAHDEINLILPGGNYGWPIVQGEEVTDQFITMKPLIQSGDTTWAPSGITFLNQGPWQGKLLVSCLRGEQLISFVLNEQGNEVIQSEFWLENSVGRLREAYQAADGSIYLMTNNLDGRGTPRENDDKIIRLIPKA